LTCIINGVSQNAYVGWYVDCKNMHGMSNTKYEVKIITVENIKICRCLGDHASFEIEAMYV
jgi:hypothetical protein